MENKNLLYIFLGIILLMTLILGFNIKQEATIVGNKVDVAIQDQDTIPLNLYLTENLANITIIVNTSLNDKTVDINSPILPTTDMLICLKEDKHFYQGEIIGVASLGGSNYRLTLSAPLDFNFSTAGGCSLRNNNLAVDGSVTPHYFTVSPSRLNDEWHINKIIFHIEDNLVMDSGKFGGISELNNGIVLRYINGINKNLLTIESNGDFEEHGATIKYNDKAPAGVYSLIATKIFNGQDNAGVTLHLTPNDTLEIIVQDDLTGLNHMHSVVIGHRIQP